MSSEYDYTNRQNEPVPEQNTLNFQNDPMSQQAPPPQPAYGTETESSGAYRMSGSGIPGNTADPYSNPGASAAAGYNRATYGAAGYTGQSGYTDPARSAAYQDPAQNPYQAAGQNPYQNPNPMSGYNVKPAQPKKKSSGSKRVIAAALICALIGGIGGGAAVGMALRGGNSDGTEAVVTVPEETDSTAPSTEEAQTSSAGEAAPANINTTVIEVTTNAETTSMTPQDVYEQYVNAVVAIANEGTTTNAFGQISETASSGSGFIISEDGYIITNNHVVEGAQMLTVTMTNGEEYDATVIGADAENDVALIKIDATGLPTVAIGSGETIEVGQQVCAIGNPLGELTNTLTVGYVSALDREINENGTPINMFQTDCAINAGNSGGPIFDMHGNVIGITTAKYSSSGSLYEASIEGIGFCVPIDDAMDIVSDLLEYGYVKGRPSLGIACQAISSTVTQYYHLPTGVYVYTVEEGSAADKAGLQDGDIITAVDGTEVDSITEFKTKLKEYSAGDTALLSVYRSSESGAETLELTVTFDEKGSRQ